MRLKTEAKIGIIVAATIGLVYWGINYLKGRNVLKRTDVYHVVYDNVAGLDLSSPVLLRGYNVGLVTDIQLPRKNPDKLVVSFAVNHNVKIPEGSSADLYSPDIMGSKAIQLILTHKDTYYKFGDTLLSSVSPDLFSKIGDQLIPVTQKLDSTLESVNSALATLLDDKTIQDFKSGIESLSQLTDNLNRQIDNNKIKNILSSLNSFTQSLDNNKGKIDTVLTNLEYITDSIAKSNLKAMIQSANLAFSETSEMMDAINNGEGSLGQFAKNDSLYNNLNSSIEHLDILLKDLNENPKRYVRFSIFGGKNKNE